MSDVRSIESSTNKSDEPVPREKLNIQLPPQPVMVEESATHDDAAETLPSSSGDEADADKLKQTDSKIDNASAALRFQQQQAARRRVTFPGRTHAAQLQQQQQHLFMQQQAAQAQLYSHYAAAPPSQFHYGSDYYGGGGGGYALPVSPHLSPHAVSVASVPGYPQPYTFTQGYATIIPGQPWPIVYPQTTAPSDPTSSPPHWSGVPIVGSPWSPSGMPPWVDVGANSDVLAGSGMRDPLDGPIHSPGPPIQLNADGHGPEGSFQASFPSNYSLALIMHTEYNTGCNLFVFHIPNEMTNVDLFNQFSPFGNVISARIMVDNDTGRSRGFGKHAQLRFNALLICSLLALRFR